MPVGTFPGFLRPKMSHESFGCGCFAAAYGTVLRVHLYFIHALGPATVLQGHWHVLKSERDAA